MRPDRRRRFAAPSSGAAEDALADGPGAAPLALLGFQRRIRTTDSSSDSMWLKDTSAMTLRDGPSCRRFFALCVAAE
eukprot:scaffold213_cov245-Pinguiococcus_pyrenoidosus.AAC.22